MKRLMVIGASVLQLPAIQKGREMGFEVAVADYDPHAVGIAYADRYYNVSTIDEPGVLRAAQDFGAEGIMTLATDMPMRAIANACAQMGLCGISYDTAIRATDKGEMIRAFERTGVAHPFYRIALGGRLEERSGLVYPLITKPTDNSGSRGVMLVHCEEELEQALAYSSQNSRGGSVIVEEYMRGPEVSVEVMVVKGKAYVLQITDKLTTGAPHFVEMGHAQPSRLPEDVQEKIRDLAGRAALAVGIENGPAHAEIIVTKDGPKMVELGARMGGDCITSHLVPLSTGIDMVGSTIRLAVGETPDLVRRLEKGAAIRYFHAAEGVIECIDGVEEARKIRGVEQITFVKAPGDRIGQIGSSADRVGFVIAQADSAQEAESICEQVLRTVCIHMGK